MFLDSMSRYHFNKSISYALRGLRHAFRTELNFRIQCVLAAMVLVAGWAIDLRKFEWIVIFFLIFSVLILELLNTALEHMLDALRPRFDVQAEMTKDIMAGAVFMGSIGAAIIGVIIFWPHIMYIID